MPPVSSPFSSRLSSGQRRALRESLAKCPTPLGGKVRVLGSTLVGYHRLPTCISLACSPGVDPWCSTSVSDPRAALCNQDTGPSEVRYYSIIYAAIDDVKAI